jgi:circadian clock protein KaiC
MEELKKSKSGIKGLDIITGGVLSRGHPSLICGAAGTGKSIWKKTSLPLIMYILGTVK